MTGNARSTLERTVRYGPLIWAVCLIGVASAGCSKAGPTKDELLANANAAFADADYGKAEKDYRQVLGLSPEDPAAVRQLAIIYHEQGQLSQAYPLLEKAAEVEPDNLEIQIKLGLTLLSLGHYQQAQEAAVAVLNKQPDNEAALAVLAGATSPDDIDYTRKLVEEYRLERSDSVGYHLALGILALRQKQRDTTGAESEFNAALRLDPKSTGGYTALASLYWNRNDLKAADEAFKTATDLSPLRSPMRLRYAEFKLRTGALEEAKTILVEVSAKYPDYLPPRVYAMRIACAEHQDENCATRIQDILAQDPINYDALFQDGVLNLAQARAAKADPANADPAMGDVAKAIREFEYLSNTYTHDPQVRYQLALAYLLSANDASLANARNAGDNAETRLNEAVEIDPNFEPAVLLFAELKIRQGGAATAADALAGLIKARPQTAQAYYLLGSAYLAQQRQDRALQVYRTMTEKFPQDPQPSFLIGDLLLAQNQPAAARNAFEKLSETAPDFLPAAERLIDLDLADKRYTAALERTQRHIDRDPKQAQPWALRAKIYMAQQDLPHAEADLLKAVDLDPALEPAYMLLAQIYVASNRQKEAIQKLNGLLEKNKSIPALMQLASIHLQLKNFPAARGTYEQLLTIAPNFFPALNNLAIVYADQLGDVDKAYELAKRAEDAAPNDARTADTLGWVLVKKGDYVGARQLLQDSSAKQPGSADVQFHLGMANYMLGDEVAARAAFQKAVDASEDFPGKEDARTRLALLAIDVQTANAAVRNDIDEYLREHPNDPAALARLAALQQRDGIEDQAIKTYEKLVADNSLYAPATRNLALFYGKRVTDASNPADILKAYDLATKAHQAYPDDSEVTKTLGILSYRQENYPRSLELLKEVEPNRSDDAELRYYIGRATIATRAPNQGVRNTPNLESEP
jgi:tetratricopeptide (TPR) repeat protein